MFGMNLPNMLVLPPAPMPGPSDGGASGAKSTGVSDAELGFAEGSQWKERCGADDSVMLVVLGACATGC